MLFAIGSFIGLCLLLDIIRRVIAYRRLRHVPGPFWASISRLYLLSRVYHAPIGFHTKLSAIQEKYGSLARIGPNKILTDDTDLVRRMYAPRSPFRRSSWQVAFKFDQDAENIGSVIDEAAHNDLRAKMIAAYTTKEVPSMEQDVEKHVFNLINLIERKYVSAGSVVKPFDLARTAQYFTIDVISDLAFGKEFGDLAADDDVHGYIGALEDSFDVLTALTLWPKLIHVMGVIQRVARIALWLIKSGIQETVDVSKEAVRRRLREEKGEKNDMLASFMRHGMTETKQLEAEAIIQLFAGSDTSATAIRAILLHIITNPHVYHRLQGEIDTADKQNLLSRPMARYAEAQQLPYLQACIKEGLRKWPPVIGLFEKVVAPEGAQVGTTFIPGGTLIGLNVWSMQHNKAVFGPDADIFRPERWLEADGDQLRRMEKDTALVFGSGRITCLGKPMAMLELNKVFVELLRRYDLTIMYPGSPWESRLLGLWSQNICG